MIDLGSAVGKIVLDTSGVDKGAAEAKAALKSVADTAPSLVSGIEKGFNEVEVNLLKMAESMSAVPKEMGKGFDEVEVNLLKMAEAMSVIPEEMGSAVDKAELSLDRLADAAPEVSRSIDKAARDAEQSLDRVTKAGPEIGTAVQGGATEATNALKKVGEAGPSIADGIKRGADGAESAIKRVANAGPSIADGIKTGVDRAEQHLGRLLSKATSIAADIGKKVALGLGVGAVALGAFGVSSVQTAAEFESSMAIMSTAVDPAEASLEDLREAALAVGADSALVGVSASSAAEAMTGLYKAGLDTTEIFGDMEGYLEGTAELSGALRASVDLAAASELDMVQASELAAVTLATFGGELETAEERAEFINAAMNNFVQTADASVAEVGDLAAALVNVGPVAASLGLSLEETNAALGILSTRGIAGSEAGTALKSMLTNLMRDTPEVNAQLQGLGVSLYDMHGNMLPLPEILAQLEQALFGVGEKTLFVSNRTEEQNGQLDAASQEYARLQGIYDKAAQSLNDYTIGVKGAGLSDEARAKKIAEQQAVMANAQAAMEGYGNQIAELESVGGETITVLSQLTEEQRNQAIQTLFGSYGQNAANALLAEGVEGWEALGEGIADASTIQEVAAARTNTFEGAMEALGGVVESFKIRVGTPFLGLLADIALKFGELIDNHAPAIESFFQNLSTVVGNLMTVLQDEGLSGLFTTFEDGSSHVGALLEAFGMDPAQADAWGAAINNVAIAIGNIIAAVQNGGLAEVFTTMEDGSSVIGDLLIALGMEEGDANGLAQTINNTAVAIGDLTTKVGAFLQEHGFTLLKVLAGAAVAMKALSIIVTVSGWIGGLKAAVTGLITTFSTAAAVGGKLAGVAAVLGGPVTLAIAAVVGAVALLAVAWANNWGGIQEKTQAVLTWLQTTIAAVLQPVIDWWNTNWPSIQTTLETVWGVIQTVIQTAIDLIRPALEQLSLSASAAFSTFSLAIPELKALWASLAPVFELVWTLLQPILAMIGAGLVALVGIAVGVVTGISKAVGPFITGLRQVIESVIQIITGVIQVVSGFFELLWGLANNNQEMMRDAFLKMKDGVVNILSGLLVGAARLVEGLVKTIFGFVSGLVEGVIKFFTNLYNELVGHSIIPDMINDIVDWFMGLPQKAADALSSLWNKVKAPFESLWTDLQNWWNGVEWNKLPEKIITKVKDGLSSFWTDIKGKFDSVWTEVQNFWDTVADWKQLGLDTIQGVLDGLTEKGAEIASTLKGFAEDAWNEVKEFFGISSPSTLFFQAGIDVIQGLIDGVISLGSKIWSLIVAPFEALFTDMTEWWGETDWETLASDLMERLVESLGLWEALQQNFDDLYTAVLEWWIGTDWEALAKETMQRIAAYLANNFWNTLSRPFAQTYDAIRTSWNSQDWTSLGKAIIDGVIAGVNANEGALRARMKAIAIAARTEAEQELGVQSPSTVFIHIGEMIVQGLILGIKTGTPALKTVVSEQGQILRDYFEQVLEDGRSMNNFLQQLPESMRTPIQDIADLMLEGSQNISSYFETVISSGDHMNQWLDKLPDFLQPHVKEIGRLIAEGNEEISSYFAHVIRTGETSNDFLEGVPDAVRPMVESLGELIADGSGAIRSYFDAVLETGDYMNEWLQELPEEVRPAMEALGQMMTDATATVEDLLSTANRLGSIGSGVAGLFQQTTLDPLQEQIDMFNESIEETYELFENLEFEFMALPEGFEELAGKEQLKIIQRYIAELERLPVLTDEQTAALNALRKAQAALNQQTADMDAMAAIETRFRNKASKVEEWLRQIGPSVGELRNQLIELFLDPDQQYSLEDKLEFIKNMPVAMREALAKYKNLTQDLNPLTAEQEQLFSTLTSLTLPSWKDELAAAMNLEEVIAAQEGDVQDTLSNLLSLEGVSNVMQLPDNFYDLPESYRKEILRRIREDLLKLKAARPDLFDLGDPHHVALSGIDGVLLDMERRNELQREYRLEEERILALQKAQQDLDFLQQQMDLLKLIRENGLDAADILDGIELGLGADQRGIIDAMVRAMQEMIKAAEAELQIASPSQVFERMGQMVNRGLALGISETVPVKRAMRNLMGVVKQPADMQGAGRQYNYDYGHNQVENKFGPSYHYHYEDGSIIEQTQVMMRPAMGG